MTPTKTFHQWNPTTGKWEKKIKQIVLPFIKERPENLKTLDKKRELKRNKEKERVRKVCKKLHSEK